MWTKAVFNSIYSQSRSCDQRYESESRFDIALKRGYEKNREFSKSYWKEFSGYHSKKNVFENGKILLLKALNEIGLEFHLFTNPVALKITADILRGTTNTIAPEPDGITLQDTLKDVVVDQAIDER